MPVERQLPELGPSKRKSSQNVHGMNELRERVRLGGKPDYSSLEGLHPNYGPIRDTMRNARNTNPMMDTEEMSILEKTLDYLSRGNYAAANVTLGLLENEGFNDLWKRAGAGISGEAKRSFIDVMDEVSPEGNKWVNISLGFAGDVVLDPINLVPMSWPKKVGQLLGLPKLLKAADDITQVSKMYKRAINVIGDAPFIGGLGRKFVPGFNLRKHEGAYDLYRDTELKIASIKRNVRRELEERWDMFREASKALGIDAQWAAAEMVRGHEAGELAKAADLEEALRKMFRINDTLNDPDAMKVLKDAYTDVVMGFETMAKNEKAAGILSNTVENYFPHIYEKGELVKLPGGKWGVKGNYGFFTSLKYRGKTFFSRPREFNSIESAKNWLASKYIEGAPIPVPIEHWFRGYAVRRFVGESALAWKGFVDNALDQFGKPLETWFEEAAKEAGYHSLEQAMKAKDAGFDKLWGIVQNKIPKGHKLVLPTTSLRSPAARTLAEKMLKEGLSAGESDLAKIFEQHGPNFLYRLFSKVKGAGLQMEIPDELVKKLGAKGVYTMPTEIADHIKNSFRMLSGDEEVKGFLGMLDNGMHLWKSMATSLRLPFHHRNAISNLWLMYQGGVKAPNMGPRLAQSMRVMLKDKSLNFQGWNSEELLEIADRYGVRAYGWIAADVPRMFQKELYISTQRSAAARKMGAGVNAYNPVETAMRLGRKYGTMIEDNSRIALFLNELKARGITKATATKDDLYDVSKHVKKYLFDYTELTQFEREVMKRVFPFYTWMRKNVPLQIESIVRHPEKFARLADVERDLFPLFTEEETPQERAIRPGWLNEMRARKLKSWETESGDPIYSWIDLPTGDLHKIQKLGKFLTSSVNPGLVLFNIAANVKTWPTPGKLAEPGQKTVAPFYVQFLPQKDWKIMGIEPIRNRKTGKIVLGMDPQWRYALNTVFPFLNDWEQVHPGGVNLGIHREGEYLPRALSYVTGIKFKPMNKTDMALQKYYRTRDYQKNIRRAGKQQTELTAEESWKIFKETMD